MGVITLPANLATNPQNRHHGGMVTRSRFLLMSVLALGVAPVLASAQTEFPRLQIKPQFVPDELILRLVDNQMPVVAPPESTTSPSDLYAAAGLTVLADRELTPPEVVEHWVHVRLADASRFGEIFRIVQTFDFGPQSTWSLRSVQPNFIYCWIPEGCPGVVETSRTFNFSARAEVQPGEKVVIGGMIVPGEFARLVVFKVRGPSLGSFGVNEPLADPTLDLHRGTTAILRNDNWRDLRDWEKTLASSLCPAPDDPLESMIVTYLDPGAYTAIVAAADGGAGVAVLEMYLLDAFRVEPGPG
jgi:hypothetical protein